MKFVCLVYIDKAKISGLTPEEDKQLTDDTIEDDHRLRREGRLILAQPLREPETAVTLREDGAGVVSATDGPFAETKEHLGGFYIIEAANMDEAKKIASTDPLMKFGSIEIRPTHEQTHSVTGEGRPELQL